MNLQNSLSKNRSLRISFIATLLIAVAIQVVVELEDLTLLDTISDPSKARDAILAMSPRQNIVHTWLTATLDVAYPIAYSALFQGSAYKFYGRWGWLIALPAFVAAPIDLLEGVVQVLGLTGVADWLAAKAVLTPLKFTLAGIGAVTTAIGWGMWLKARLRSS